MRPLRLVTPSGRAAATNTSVVDAPASSNTWSGTSGVGKMVPLARMAATSSEVVKPVANSIGKLSPTLDPELVG